MKTTLRKQLEILAIITLLTSCNSDGIYEATMRLDEINKTSYAVDLYMYRASKIEGDFELLGGPIRDTSLFTKAKVGDTIKVVINENDKTTKIYFKGKLIEKTEIPLDWDLRK